MRKLCVFLAVSVALIVAVNVAAAGAQTFTVSASCVGSELTVTWANGNANGEARVIVTQDGATDTITEDLTGLETAGQHTVTVTAGQGMVQMQFRGDRPMTATWTCSAAPDPVADDALVTAVERVETLLTEAQAADARRQSQLAQMVVTLDQARNQARHQTQALLALVALIFAMWLRPILRSRREVS